MKNNNIPLEGDGWNSDEIVIGDLSCKQVSKFLSAHISAVRAFGHAEANGGAIECLRLAKRLIDAQIAVLDSGQLKDGDKEFASQNIHLGLMSVGQAMVGCSTTTDPRSTADLSHQAMGCFIEMIEKLGQDKAEKTHMRFHIKNKGAANGEARMVIGVEAIPVSDMVKLMADVLPPSSHVQNLESTQKYGDN